MGILIEMENFNEITFVQMKILSRTIIKPPAQANWAEDNKISKSI